ncbi:uncharacterized protein LOC124165440 isoform X2 [Ischnura elegans]|uniref:uncharacterized protein LOC124165440 isoform X2 n=1 Tax=Ischnura elegans TaxID=197161 RepID=UPI001ED89205|nr:uncharacterized protein LOC124165440 isoform X2 [Ischnura elegans]
MSTVPGRSPGKDPFKKAEPVMKNLKSSIRGITLKKFFFFIVAVCSVLICFFIHGSYISSVEAEFYRIHVEEYLLRDERNSSSVPDSHPCILPDYDPFDPSILQYIRPWQKILCGQTQPYLTYVDSDGFIRRNISGIKSSGIPNVDLQCAYQDIERGNHTDNRVRLRPPLIFNEPEILLSEFVVVKCYQLPYGRLVYETAHAYVPSLASKGLKPIAHEFEDRSKPNQPSVFILVFDSMSRLNFINQLPKTYNFLTNILKAHIFKGLTKTGDNTYPNMMPMLSGMAAYKHLFKDDVLPDEKLHIPVWGDTQSRHQNFDDVPFVWKNFSQAGYVTMFAEDLPEFSIFNYLAKGFFNPPTDYYMRPFWLAIDKIKTFKSSDSRCYGNIPQHMFLFNYTEEFVRKMSHVRYFAFSFLTALSHDHINSIKVVDNDIVSMLKRIWTGGGFKNAITIVMGDHGNRYDNIRSTVIGRVEERMPFFSISLPESFQQSHSHLHQGLMLNRATLMSWFDIYELLMDIAMDNLGPVSKVPRWGTVGLSPFRPLPKNRSCLEIGIPRTYCVCGNEKEMSPEDPHAIEAAEALVSHVNKMIIESGFRFKCSELKLVKVLNAQLMLPSAPIISPAGLVIETRVSVETSPGGAQLEAILKRDAWSENGGHVIGDVNRINKYGNQSFCVEDLMMKLYCFCDSSLPLV